MKSLESVIASKKGGIRELWSQSGLRIPVGLALGPAVTIGFGRFAYALLLPSMRTDLHWSLTVAGAMSSANAIGYLAGAILASGVARRLGSRYVFIASLIITVCLLALTAVSGNLAILAIVRLLAGVFGAMNYISGAGLVLKAVSSSSSYRAARLLGVYFTGVGTGIILSGIAIPYLLSVTSAVDGWRLGWILLGVMGLVALGGAIPTALSCKEPPLSPITERRVPLRRLAMPLISYTLVGIGYIAYMTFIVAYLKGIGEGQGQITLFWVILGIAAIVGAFIWAPLIGKFRAGRGLAAVIFAVAIGAMLPLASHSTTAALFSAILFGGSFLSIVTAVTAVARRSLKPHHWGPAIGVLTVAFALGQTLGPVFAGTLSEGPTGLTLGLEVSVALLLTAALVALLHRHHDTPTDTLAES